MHDLTENACYFYSEMELPLCFLGHKMPLTFLLYDLSFRCKAQAINSFHFYYDLLEEWRMRVVY